MQTLDVISVNIWQIVISLLNLILLFLILKRFLFKPVKKMLKKRQDELNSQYEAAKQAEMEADEYRKDWEEKLATANEQADAILQSATDSAKRHGDKLITDAQERAESIVRMAENEAELERKKATDGIKREIVEVSGALTEKMLEREIKAEDHRALIDSFIDEIGEDND